MVSASRFLKLLVFPCLQLKSWIRTYLCSLPQYRYLFDTLFARNPNIHGQEMMLVLPKKASFMRIFQVGSMFSLLPSSLTSSTDTDRNSPLARLTNKHSQFTTFSQPHRKRTSPNCRSHCSLPLYC